MLSLSVLFLAILAAFGTEASLSSSKPNCNNTNRRYKTRELVEISGLSVKDIVFGLYGFIVILTEDGYVWTAGANSHGQLSGDRESRPTFTKVLGVPAVMQIAVGVENCVVLGEDNGLYSWGRGKGGYANALGYTPTNVSNPTPTKFSLGQGAPSPTSICCSLETCQALTTDGEVFTWGHPSYSGGGGSSVPGRVSRFPSGETIDKSDVPCVLWVACGSSHMVALASSGRLYGWGSSQYGQLGMQANNYAPYPTELHLEGQSVLDVVAGGLITIVRTDDDEFYFFGWYEGQPIFNATQLVGGLYPMDLMAKGLNGQATFQAVSLGCK